MVVTLLVGRFLGIFSVINRGALISTVCYTWGKLVRWIRRAEIDTFLQRPSCTVSSLDLLISIVIRVLIISWIVDGVVVIVVSLRQLRTKQLRLSNRWVPGTWVNHHQKEVCNLDMDCNLFQEVQIGWIWKGFWNWMAQRKGFHYWNWAKMANF